MTLNLHRTWIETETPGEGGVNQKRQFWNPKLMFLIDPPPPLHHLAGLRHSGQLPRIWIHGSTQVPSSML